MREGGETNSHTSSPSLSPSPSPRTAPCSCASLLPGSWDLHLPSPSSPPSLADPRDSSRLVRF
eukprot:749521-Hanusia_phi.AAC.4